MFGVRHIGSLRDYVKNYIALMLQNDDMAESEKLYHFIARLQNWVQMELYCQKVTTLKEAILVRYTSRFEGARGHGP